MQFTLHFSQILSYDQGLQRDRNAQIHDDLSNAMPQAPDGITAPLLPSGYPVEAAAGSGPVTPQIPLWNKPICKDNFWCQMILGVNPWGDGSVRLWEVPISLGLWLLTLLGGAGLYARLGLWGGRLALLADRLPLLARVFEYGSRLLVWARELPGLAKVLDLVKSIKPAVLEDAFDFFKVKGGLKVGDSLLKAEATSALFTSRNEIWGTYNGVKPTGWKAYFQWWGETTPWGIVNGLWEHIVNLAFCRGGLDSLWGVKAGFEGLFLERGAVLAWLKEGLTAESILSGIKGFPGKLLSSGESALGKLSDFKALSLEETMAMSRTYALSFTDPLLLEERLGTMAINAHKFALFMLPSQIFEMNWSVLMYNLDELRAGRYDFKSFNLYESEWGGMYRNLYDDGFKMFLELGPLTETGLGRAALENFVPYLGRMTLFDELFPSLKGTLIGSEDPRSGQN